jgi:hypothetical protein
MSQYNILSGIIERNIELCVIFSKINAISLCLTSKLTTIKPLLVRGILRPWAKKFFKNWKSSTINRISVNFQRIDQLNSFFLKS